ncbi:hypothetical protein MCHI_002367 [Candidatus Magnetoovum chiemensis]|nr:hypothetical protein MCHI_002367 [Candidatus Magnetoovum chiemensis]
MPSKSSTSGKRTESEGQHEGSAKRNVKGNRKRPRNNRCTLK